MFGRKKPIPDESPAPPAGDSSCPPEAQSEGPEEFREKWLRSLAELENIRKRHRRDLATVRAQEREAVMRGFLLVLDNFDRALAMQGAESNEWIAGFEAIRAQMLDTFRSFGAEPFDAAAELFDPMRHEAVAVVDVPEREDGAIIEVIRTGYAMPADDRILRPAQVVVVRRAEPPPE